MKLADVDHQVLPRLSEADMHIANAKNYAWEVTRSMRRCLEQSTNLDESTIDTLCANIGITVVACYLAGVCEASRDRRVNYDGLRAFNTATEAIRAVRTGRALDEVVRAFKVAFEAD